MAESVRLARESVVEIAVRHGASSRTAQDIRLAVSEAASNVVRHAYPVDRPGSFRVGTVLGARHLLVTVEDDGCGLCEPSTRPGMGLGLELMDRLADEAFFRERAAGGSRVQLRFELG